MRFACTSAASSVAPWSVEAQGGGPCSGLWGPGTQLALHRPSHSSCLPSQLRSGPLHAASRNFDRPGVGPLFCWPA